MASFAIHHGDALDVLRGMPDNSVDAVVTDPPYGLGKEPDAAEVLRDWVTKGFHEVKASGGFMGKAWDSFVPQPLLWKEVFRVLKPGGHLLSFAGTRTYDWMVMSVRLAGFEIRDMVNWVYGSGFPKSLNLKDVQPGFGTALKPAHEPIVLARKPLSESNIAANVLRWGTGGVNVDGCRVEGIDPANAKRLGRDYTSDNTNFGQGVGQVKAAVVGGTLAGRFPANLIHDGSAEVVGMFPESKDGVAGRRTGQNGVGNWGYAAQSEKWGGYNGEGSAARFFKACPPDDAASLFYCAKASRSERDAGLDGMDARNHHPTVKPQSLMRYLCRLITPPSGVILDPFFGSGSTGAAAIAEGFSIVGIEQDAEFVEIARRRCEHAKEVKPLREQRQVSLLEICAENAA